MKWCGVRTFSGKRVGEYPFFSKEKNCIYMFGNFGHFVSQKVLKYSKIAQNSILGRFEVFYATLSYFSRISHFSADFGIFSTLILTYDPQCTVWGPACLTVTSICNTT
jgi:hypothetical protein